ncbi:MAG: hypothetical protein HPY44_04485 [Armatimonadetes bacterium]|nr:hypothetical protein [Armatimonadota bacterium]
MDELIVIEAESTAEGIRMEYEWVSALHGEQGRDWQLVRQALIFLDDKKVDELHIRLADGTEKRYRFDITSFFGRF